MFRFIELTSSDNVYKGKDYAKNNIVSNVKISNNIITGNIVGSNGNVYTITLNLEKPRTSTCTCPYSQSSHNDKFKTEKICKHKIALLFTAYPDLLKKYEKLLKEKQEKMQKYNDKLPNKIEMKLNKMSKKELIDIIYAYIINTDGWQYNKFIKDVIDD